MNLLLLSNSTMVGSPYLDWPKDYIDRFLGNVRSAVFIPYAAVGFTYDKYEEMVAEALGTINVRVTSIHHSDDPQSALESAEAIIVGGGNTFHLLYQLYELDLVQAIRRAVKDDTPYIGWSAGANMACPTIKTTNDMPIIEPKSFEALNLIPYQINPHYTERTIPGHGGESRLQRLKEFSAINKLKVVCLPEGCGMLVNNSETRLLAAEPIKVINVGGDFDILQPGIIDI